MKLDKQNTERQRVLLTGAFGNIGVSTIKELIKQGYKVRCFDLETKKNKKISKRYNGQVEIIWGDIRNPDDVTAAVINQEVVIHLAFIIPPLSEVRPEWAKEINVGGTRNLLGIIKNASTFPKIIFASTVAVFGDTQDKPPPRVVSDPVQPIEHYARHKVECEKFIQESGLNWSILRFGAVPSLKIFLKDSLQFKMMFEVPLKTRIEFVHTRDVGLALANAVSCKEVFGKILLIGGGPGCQLYYRDYVGGMLEALGIGMFPDKAFGSAPFHTDWMDTKESQRILKYQRHSFDDFIKEMALSLGFRRYLIKIMRPLIRSRILKRSPYL